MHDPPFAVLLTPFALISACLNCEKQAYFQKFCSQASPEDAPVQIKKQATFVVRKESLVLKNLEAVSCGFT